VFTRSVDFVVLNFFSPHVSAKVSGAGTSRSRLGQNAQCLGLVSVSDLCVSGLVSVSAWKVSCTSLVCHVVSCLPVKHTFYKQPKTMQLSKLLSFCGKSWLRKFSQLYGKWRSLSMVILNFGPDVEQVPKSLGIRRHHCKHVIWGKGEVVWSCKLWVKFECSIIKGCRNN